ncbi:hypothetical protein ACHWQZ_G006295 [Mnemiopsis leidyi]
MSLLPNLEYDATFLDNHVSSPEKKPFLDDLSLEISAVCKHSSSKVQSFYVVDDPSILNFNCEDFSKYPSLKKLLKFVNNQYGCSLNSCVANCYNVGQSRKLPHADDESYIDQLQPICTFTIGTARNVLFFDSQALSSGDSPQLALVQNLNPIEGSVYVMNPSFQSRYKHQVQPGSGKRMSVSFRRVVQVPVKFNEWPFNLMKGRGSNVSNPLLQSDSSDQLVRPQPKLILPEPPSINRRSSAGDIIMCKRSTLSADEMNLLSKDECRKLIVQLQARISHLEIEEYKLGEGEVDTLVGYEESPLEKVGADSPELLPRVMKDITDIVDESPRQDSISTHWLLDNPSVTPFLVGKEISKYPGIVDLLNHVKTLEQGNECLNACLLTKYPNGEAKSRLHSDNEVYICNDSPICNFSIGEQRTIKFFNARVHSGPALKTIPMNSLSVVTMRPNCQQKLKHIVLPNPNAVGPRFCLSFRKVKPITEKKQELETSTEPPSTVLIGTSVTKRINPAKIVGKATCKFVNCSTSGDTIQDASDKLDKLYAGTLTDYSDKPVGTILNIKNIILSVGTNDIRRKSNGVSSLYLPVRALLKKASDLFPNCQVYVQSVIPMGYEYKWTASNVMSFNSLLRRCVKEIPNCSYLDVFDDFIQRGYPIKALFYDHLHPSSRGAAVLARSFIAVTRGRNFNIRV